MEEKKLKLLAKKHLLIALAKLATKKDVAKVDKKMNDLTVSIKKTILELHN